jgi:hypothetical protein
MHACGNEWPSVDLAGVRQPRDSRQPLRIGEIRETARHHGKEAGIVIPGLSALLRAEPGIRASVRRAKQIPACSFTAS